MWTTLLFGAVASSALIIGAAVGIRFQLPKRLLAMLLAFAAGALITALSFELFEDSYERGGIWLAAIGLFAGSGRLHRPQRPPGPVGASWPPGGAGG